MKELVCKMCGGNELTKQGDNYLCNLCGTQFADETHRKITVTQDNSKELAGCIDLAEEALSLKKHEEALSYCNKAILLDSKNVRVKLLKGRALIRKSVITLDDKQFKESRYCFTDVITEYIKNG